MQTARVFTRRSRRFRLPRRCCGAASEATHSETVRRELRRAPRAGGEGSTPSGCARASSAARSRRRPTSMRSPNVLRDSAAGHVDPGLRDGASRQQLEQICTRRPRRLASPHGSEADRDGALTERRRSARVLVQLDGNLREPRARRIHDERLVVALGLDRFHQRGNSLAFNSRASIDPSSVLVPVILPASLPKYFALKPVARERAPFCSMFADSDIL